MFWIGFIVGGITAAIVILGVAYALFSIAEGTAPDRWF